MAAVDLAMHSGVLPVQAKSIAKRQGIPARFLEQVLYAMKKAGLVSSQRGAQGGYVLSKKPTELSLADVLEALDGPLLTAGVSNNRPPHQRMTKSELLLTKVWEQVHEAERDVLEAITIDELAGKQRVLDQQRTLMYHI